METGSSKRSGNQDTRAPAGAAGPFRELGTPRDLPAPPPATPRILQQLDLNLLRVFEALFLAQSVSRAAEQLGLTQSGMSRALGRLRAHFGDRLFLSTGSKLIPTQQAEALAEPIRGALETLRRGLSACGRFDAFSTERTFTVAMADYCEAMLLPPLVSEIRRQAPGVQIHSVPTLPNDGERLLRGELDMAVTSRPLRGGLVVRRLMTDSFAVVVRSDHAALQDGRIGLAEYLSLGHLDVAPPGRLGSPVDDVLAGIGRARTVTVRVHSLLAASALLTESDLVATLPRRIALRLADEAPLSLAPPPFEVSDLELVLSWSERVHSEPAHRWMRERLLAAGGAFGARVAHDRQA
jgi:LysR family transcriptional regulator, transcriptional activator of nodD3 and syrA